MNKAWFGFLGVLVAGFALAIFTGCEINEDKYDDLRFENASRFTVQVRPLTTEWGGFALAPGEKIKFDKVKQPDFTWQPLNRVDLSVSSTDRNVIFIDRAPTLNPPFIIVTNTSR